MTKLEQNKRDGAAACYTVAMRHAGELAKLALDFSNGRGRGSDLLSMQRRIAALLADRDRMLDDADLLQRAELEMAEHRGWSLSGVPHRLTAPQLELLRSAKAADLSDIVLTAGPQMRALVSKGLMRPAGRWNSLMYGPFRITPKGRTVLADAERAAGTQTEQTANEEGKLLDGSTGHT